MLGVARCLSRVLRHRQDPPPRFESFRGGSSVAPCLFPIQQTSLVLIELWLVRHCLFISGKANDRPPKNRSPWRAQGLLCLRFGTFALRLWSPPAHFRFSQGAYGAFPKLAACRPQCRLPHQSSLWLILPTQREFRGGNVGPKSHCSQGSFPLPTFLSPSGNVMGHLSLSMSSPVCSTQVHRGPVMFPQRRGRPYGDYV